MAVTMAVPSFLSEQVQIKSKDCLQNYLPLIMDAKLKMKLIKLPWQI
jgi:hypothetical protein